MPQVSIREYARLRGVSYMAVQRAIESKRLISSVVKSRQGHKNIVIIDSEIADNEWPRGAKELAQENYRASKARSNQSSSNEPNITGIAQTFAQSRAVRETYQARLAKLEYEEKSSKLVDAEEVRKEWVRVASIVKTKFLGLPSKLRQRIPHMSNADFAITEILVREALEDLSSDPPGGEVE